MKKFKVGDLVYCLPLTHKISKITRANEDNDVFLDKAGWFKNTGLNHNDMPVIFHATQENYELLSKLYPNVEFEKPSIRKAPREVIREMICGGYAYICYKFNSGEVAITKVDDNFVDHNLRYNFNLYQPFDPKTGKIIVDFVGGKVVLESENEK